MNQFVTKLNQFLMVLMLVFLPVSGAIAIDPSEVLSDPVLEKRARSISAGLRCLVCQNQSIDESDADLAKDLRMVVRERLLEGDSDTEVIDYVVNRYGEFVLLQPTFALHNLVLWLTAPLLFIIGAIGLLAVNRKRKPSGPSPLSEKEKAELEKLLKDDE
jgi:cytochrome c-type biogenesis protein CcmH